MQWKVLYVTLGEFKSNIFHLSIKAHSWEKKGKVIQTQHTFVTWYIECKYRLGNELDILLFLNLEYVSYQFAWKYKC